jgi:hypothetical protein
MALGWAVAVVLFLVSNSSHKPGDRGRDGRAHGVAQLVLARVLKSGAAAARLVLAHTLKSGAAVARLVFAHTLKSGAAAARHRQ